MTEMQTSGSELSSSASQIESSGGAQIEQKRKEILGKKSVMQWRKKESDNLYSKVDGNMSQRVLHNMKARAIEVALEKEDPLTQCIWQSIQTFFSKLVAQIRLDDTKSADFALLDELMEAIERQDVDGFKAVLDIFETRYPETKKELKHHMRSSLTDKNVSNSKIATALLELLEISREKTEE